MFNRLTEIMIKLYSENKALVRGILNSVIVKFLSIFVTFFTVPAYMQYFSNQAVLGVWFTLVAVFNMFLQFDLGIGNGLRNRLTESFATKNFAETKKYISSAYILITVFTFCIGILVLFLIQLAPLNLLLNLPENIIAASDLKLGISICVVGLCFQCVFRLVTSIYYSLQKAAIPSFLLFISNLLLLLVVCLVPQKEAVSQNFIFLSFAHAVLTNVPMIIASICVFCRELSKAKPNLHDFNFVIGLDLLKLGLTFFILQITALLLTNFNELLITAYINPEATVEYQVYYKIFSFPSTFFF